MSLQSKNMGKKTGSNLQHHKEYLLRKTTLLDTKYPDRWYFVLTDAQWLKRYNTTFKRYILLRHNIVRFLKKQFPCVQDNGYDLRLTKNTDDKKTISGGAQKSSSGEKTVQEVNA